VPAQVSDWYTRFSEPVRPRERSRDLLASYTRNPYYFSPPLAYQTAWFRPFGEPVRRRPPHREHYYYTRNSYYFSPPLAYLTAWFRQLSEPVRARPPLPRGAIPVHFLQLTFTSYNLQATELSDVGAFSFNPPISNMARVSITEIQLYNAQVTIREINRNRGYS